jgi:hypothetical protein
MSYVWRNSPSKGGRLLVLLALADRANDDWICWPGVNELSRKSRLSPRHVERVLKELHKDDEIEYPPNKPSKDSPIRIRQNVGSDSSTPASGRNDAGVGSDTTRASGLCNEPSEEPSDLTPSAREREIQEVWTTYLEATKKRFELNDKRRKIINRALDSAPAETQPERLALCKLAVVGLSLSPHHNGENESKTPYLDIRYALKGIREESDDERIQRMANIARQHGVSGAAQRIDPARVERRLEAVRANRSSGGNFEPDRAAAALAELEEWGFHVELLDQAPWARLDSPSRGPERPEDAEPGQEAA